MWVYRLEVKAMAFVCVPHQQKEVKWLLTAGDHHGHSAHTFSLVSPYLLGKKLKQCLQSLFVLIIWTKTLWHTHAHYQNS